MTSVVNSALMRLPKRAESTAPERLIETFVDVGALTTLISSIDHQIVFGRRGTGKTHVLSYLTAAKTKARDAVAFVDLRNVGSTGGLYADPTIPLGERATRLLVDVLSAVHEALYQFFLENGEELNLSTTGPALDALANAILEVRVIGPVEVSDESGTSQKLSQGSKAGFSLAVDKTPAATVESKSSSEIERAEKLAVRRTGDERLTVNFGSVGQAFREIVTLLGARRLWVLLDEWSSIPAELQPFLADLLRRTLFPTRGVTVKIAAIEHRCNFQIVRSPGNYLGIEVGADASADINLDDFMVFDSDADRARDFYERLISKHVKALLAEEDSGATPLDERKVPGLAFTEKRAVEEFVRSCEGVPRDAINIVGLAAQRAVDSPISVQDIRVAARNWYQRDKDKAVSAHPAAQRLLHWIIDEVIGNRKARAFLLRSGTADPLIELLYDSRVLHLLKRGVSTHDQPGIRYDVFKLDYGCYVDLVSTAKAPQGLLPLDGTPSEPAGFLEVPPDDYRSIRRAILDLETFNQGG